MKWWTSRQRTSGFRGAWRHRELNRCKSVYLRNDPGALQNRVAHRNRSRNLDPAWLTPNHRAHQLETSWLSSCRGPYSFIVYGVKHASHGTTFTVNLTTAIPTGTVVQCYTQPPQRKENTKQGLWPLKDLNFRAEIVVKRFTYRTGKVRSVVPSKNVFPHVRPGNSAFVFGVFNCRAFPKCPRAVQTVLFIRLVWSFWLNCDIGDLNQTRLFRPCPRIYMRLTNSMPMQPLHEHSGEPVWICRVCVTLDLALPIDLCDSLLLTPSLFIALVSAIPIKVSSPQAPTWLQIVGNVIGCCLYGALTVQVCASLRICTW